MKKIFLILILINNTALCNVMTHAEYKIIKKDCQDLMREVYNPFIKCNINNTVAFWDKDKDTLHCLCLR